MKHLFVRALLSVCVSFSAGLNVAVSSDEKIDDRESTHAGRLPTSGFSDLCLLLNRKVHPAVEAIDLLLNDIRRPYDIDSWRSYVTEASEYIYQMDNRTKWQPLLHSSPRIYFLSPLRPFSLIEVEAEFGRFLRRLQFPGKLAFHCVEGVDVQKIPHSPFSRFGVLQVAGQFNFLTSQQPERTPIPGYLDDDTQGSRASLNFLSLLLVRDYLFGKPEVQRSLQPLFAHLPSDAYSWGHLKPAAIPEGQRPEFIKHLQENIGSLNIFAEWSDRPEFGGEDESLLQVFTAAPSFQAEGVSEPSGFEYQVSDLLVPVQYRAVAQLAVVKSLGLHGRLPLHLTLVGQGGLNNPESVMMKAFQAVFDVAKSYPIDVFVHAGNSKDVAMIRRNLPEGARVDSMTAAEFFSGSFPVSSKSAIKKE